MNKSVFSGELIKEQDIDYEMDDFGSQIMDIISKGLYAIPTHVIREFVQNAVDAKPNPEDPITISIQGRDIFIYDKGQGMNEEQLKEAKKIAITSKTVGENVGFRGIGIWSALGLAEKLILSTTVKGEDKRRVLIINYDDILRCVHPQKNIKEVLDKNVKIRIYKDDPDKHGTTAEIRNIKPEAVDELANKTKIKEYMRQTLPVPFPKEFELREKIEDLLRRNVPGHRSYLIKLDGEPINKFHTDDVEDPVYDLVKLDNGEKLCFYWACLNKNDGQIDDPLCRGLKYMSKGFSIGGANNTIELFKVSDHLAKWHFGEIHVIHEDLIPDAERAYFEATPTRKKLKEKGQKIAERLGDNARLRSAKNKADKRTNEASDRVGEIIDEIPTIKDLETAYGIKRELDDAIEKVEKDITIKTSGKRKGETNCSSSYIDIGRETIENAKGAITQLEEKIKTLKKEEVEDEIEADQLEETEEEKGTEEEGEKTEEPTEDKTSEEDIKKIEEEILTKNTKKTTQDIMEIIVDILKEKLDCENDTYEEIIRLIHERIFK